VKQNELQQCGQCEAMVWLSRGKGKANERLLRIGNEEASERGK
jgi:hypothetical protein